MTAWFCTAVEVRSRRWKRCVRGQISGPPHGAIDRGVAVGFRRPDWQWPGQVSEREIPARRFCQRFRYLSPGGLGSPSRSFFEAGPGIQPIIARGFVMRSGGGCFRMICGRVLALRGDRSRRRKRMERFRQRVRNGSKWAFRRGRFPIRSRGACCQAARGFVSCSCGDHD